jgi:DNA mismatch repair protein MutS
MAQVGSFVPASSARIGIVDRIFTRVGAQDDLASGQSTFMVEMVETAQILHHATPRSLIVFDEIGRGTSTYDGMAIARAVVEYVHNHPRLGARTLFATHYHELTELAQLFPRIRNYSTAVAEEDGKPVFLRRVIPGGADRSYGVHVAQMAGLPRPVIHRAEELLKILEERRDGVHRSRARRRAAGPRAEDAVTAEQVPQLELFASQPPSQLLEELKALDIASMTPLEAITKLYELQRRVVEG